MIVKKIKSFTPGIDISSQHGTDPMFEGVLSFDVTFYMEPAQSKSHKKRTELYGKHHTFKPDLDNLIKFILDICNGILYNDDCIVSEIKARKVYDPIARTEFTVKELK